MARLANITFACEDPSRLAEFWCQAIGYVRQEAPPAFPEAYVAAGRDLGGAAAAVDPDGHGPRLFFRRGPKTPTRAVPIHLDASAPDRPGEVARLVTLGGTVVETRSRTTGDQVERWTVMRDPEGNGFCVQ